MTNRQVAMKLVTEQLGLSSEQREFDDRLKLQKAIYLLQEAGFAFNYKFSWYIRGPYSPELTEDAFSTKDDQAPEGFQLGAKSQAKLEKLMPLFNYLKQDEPGDKAARKLQRFSSVLFAINTKQSDSADYEEITDRMKKAGKEYTVEEVRETVKKKKKVGLIKE